MKKALITGITGQDGSHLAELLLAKDYRVFGMLRAGGPEDHPSTRDGQVRDILDGVELFEGDLLDQASVARILEDVRPDEIYNLASLSFVPASWQEPVLTAEYSAVGVTRLLDAMRRICPAARFYQASSSEMFGAPKSMPQAEDTTFRPRSPYGVAKLYAHHITVNYRENYGLYAASGILFNHEGPRRGLEFVTRKITHTAARIKLGLASELRLGNLQARRDWGYAGDYVRAMWLMLQRDEPEDFVIGSGETHSVKEFVEIAFDRLGLDWELYVVVDERFYRPAETVVLQADNAKARRLLGWQPETSFRELVTMMVDADMELLQNTSRVRSENLGGRIARVKGKTNSCSLLNAHS
jgi:GDPmannose 4,6-dehydratase